MYASPCTNMHQSDNKAQGHPLMPHLLSLSYVWFMIRLFWNRSGKFQINNRIFSLFSRRTHLSTCQWWTTYRISVTGQLSRRSSPSTVPTHCRARPCAWAAWPPYKTACTILCSSTTSAKPAYHTTCFICCQRMLPIWEGECWSLTMPLPLNNITQDSRTSPLLFDRIQRLVIK